MLYQLSYTGFFGKGNTRPWRKQRLKTSHNLPINTGEVIDLSAMPDVRQTDAPPELVQLQLAEAVRQLTDLRARQRQMTDALESAYLDTLMRLVLASALRDQETGAHIKRIGMYSGLLALQAGLSMAQADIVGKAAPMHDVGKLGVPDRILTKATPLTVEEWGLLKAHCEIGAQLLSGSPSPLIQVAERIALGHHERFDGSGYPSGLRGEEIPLEARIVALVDVYDALRSSRPYKPALSHEHTCMILLQGDHRTKPEHFDPDLLQAFRECRDKFGAIFDAFGDQEDRIHRTIQAL